MRLFGPLDHVGRAVAWVAALGLGAAVLAFVPSPWTLLESLRPLPAPEIRAAPKLVLAPSLAVDAFEELTHRPLFNPDRVPDPAGTAASAGVTAGTPALGDLSGYRVVGIAGDSATRVALVRNGGGGTVTLRRGDMLEGWTVTGIDGRGVSISGGGRTEVLAIPRAPNGSGVSP